MSADVRARWPRPFFPRCQRLLTASSGADLISAVAAMSTEERRVFLDDAFVRMKAAQGDIVAAVGEVDRGQEYRDEGATSTESWLVERYGVSTATARSLTQVGKKAWDIPHLVGSLVPGRDLLRQGAGAWPTWPPPRPSAAVRPGQGASVRELADIARSKLSWPGRLAPSRSRSEHDRRFLRFNDTYRTISAQLPPDPTPRPRPPSMPSSSRSHLTARHPWTSVAATP